MCHQITRLLLLCAIVIQPTHANRQLGISPAENEAAALASGTTSLHRGFASGASNVFDVSQPVDGGVLGLQWQRGLRQAAATEFPTSSSFKVPLPPQLPPAEQYLDFLVCKGFCNQVTGLVEGLVVAHLLNITAVLPKFYKSYRFTDKATRFGNNWKAQYDPSADQAVPLGYFWDMDYLVEQLRGKVKVVPELPTYLKGDPGGTYTNPDAIDPLDPRSLLRYQQVLTRRRVLRVLCINNIMKWTTPELGQLRMHILAALRPSARVMAALSQRLQTINSALAPAGLALRPVGPAAAASSSNSSSGSGYLSMHLRTEEDWREYCRKESGKPDHSWVSSFDLCYVPHDKAAKALAEVLKAAPRGAAPRILYVATGHLTEAQTLQMLDITNLAAVVNEQVVCMRPANASATCKAYPTSLGEERELRAAIDLQLLLGSSFFLGNTFSSLSFSVRLLKYMARSDPLKVPNDAMYYNAQPADVALDATRLEGRRFGFYAGVMRPSMYASPTSRARVAQLLRHQAAGRCTHVLNWGHECDAQPSADMLASGGGIETKHIAFAQMEGRDGEVLVSGRMRSNLAGYPQKVDILLDGQVRMQVIATRYRRDAPPGEGDFRVHIPVGVPAGRTRVVGVMACAPKGLGKSACSDTHNLNVPALLSRGLTREQIASDTPPVVYLTIRPAQPGVFVPGGGLMSMHQLHGEINHWFEAGEVAVRSVLSGGLQSYQMDHSNFTGYPLEPSIITARDHLVSPDKRFHLPGWHQQYRNLLGFTTSVYYLGQHSARLEGVMNLEGFRPLCRTHFLGNLFSCPPKANLITPMGPEVYAEAERFKRLDKKPPKEDIVLLDPDDTFSHDTTRLQLPAGAKLVFLDGYKKSEVFELYKRAKVYIDTFMTGVERQIQESAMFGVIPIVAHHGNGLDSSDFPIPMRWRWRPHNYTHLNELVHDALANHEASRAAFKALRAYTRTMPAAFTQQVKTYFQDDVHVILHGWARGGVGSVDEGAAALLSALMTAANYPFSTQEVVSPNSLYWAFDYAALVQGLNSVGLGQSMSASVLLAEVKRFEPAFAVYLQPPQGRRFRKYNLLVPPGVVPLHPGLLRAMFKAAHARGAAAVAGPQGLLLVSFAPYFGAVDRLLRYLPDNADLGLLLDALQHMGLKVLTVGAAELQGEEPSLAGCPVATLRLFEPLPAEAACICPHLQDVLHTKQLAAMLLHVPPAINKIGDWVRDAQRACAGHDEQIQKERRQQKTQ